MKLSFLLFAGVALCSGVLRAAPVVAYSNLGSGFDPINGLSVNEGVAVPFTVSLTAPEGQAYVLSDIQIAAADSDSSDTAAVALYDDSGIGGTPGTELDSIGIDLSTTASVVTADSINQPILVDGDTYWVVLRSSDANGAATWNYNGLFVSGAATETDGVWTYNPDAYTQGAVEVDADLVTSTPEPGTLLTFAAGFSAILMAGRRRIRQ